MKFPIKLESGAKLVESIYSCRRNFLQQFIPASNGHSLAANRIIEEFTVRVHRKRKELYMLPITEIQAISRELLAGSNLYEAVRLFQVSKFQGIMDNKDYYVS